MLASQRMKKRYPFSVPEKISAADHCVAPSSGDVFTSGLRVLSQPPLVTRTSILKNTLKEGLLRKNFNKAP